MVPYAEYRTDGGVYRAIDRKQFPRRPKELMAPNERATWMWGLLMKCWDYDPAARPSASSVLKSVACEDLNTKDQVQEMEQYRVPGAYNEEW